MNDNMDGGRQQPRRPASHRHDDDLLAFVNKLLAACLDRELLQVAEPQRLPAMTEVTYAN